MIWNSKIDWKQPPLPAEFAAQLRAMHPPTGPGHRNVRPPTQLRIVLAAAREKGWHLQTLADALGLSRERIRQLADGIEVGDYPVPVVVPAAPPRPLTKEQQERANRPQKPRLTEAEKAELFALKRRAMANGVTRPDHPRIAAGIEFAALIDSYIRRGYLRSDIAKACNVTVTAISLRLGRYGYQPLPPSQQRHNPGPIAAALAAERTKQ